MSEQNANIIAYDILYHWDVKDCLRTWQMEREGNSHRVIAGLQDGEKVVSKWKKCKPKNVGRANATTGEEQAHSEVLSLYKKRREKGWYDSPEEAKSGPLFFECMLAEKYEDNDTVFPVFSQPKLDGIRCIANKDGLWSRGGKKIVSSPHIWEALAPVWETNPAIVFDGELYNHHFKDDFNEISSLVKTTKPKPEHIPLTKKWVQYHIYDVYTGPDDEFGLRNRALLNAQSRDDIDWSCIQLVTTAIVSNQELLDELYDTYLEEGYEGQMIRYNGPYEHKRSKFLLKRKEFIDDEFQIVEIVEGKGNWSGCAKSIEIAHDGVTSSAGIRGSREYMQQVLKDADSYIGTMAKVRYHKKTPAGKLRMAVVLELDRTV